MSAEESLALMVKDEWTLDAACRDMDPKNFYLDQMDPLFEDKLAIALRVCDGCPVRQNCEDAGRARREEYGIWGGIYVEDPEFSW